MAVHSPAVSKRLWNILRVTFLMMRKGLISKRKLIMDMNLMMKRGKLFRKTFSNLMSTQQHTARGSFGIQEYEFSCSNSPNPVFFHLPSKRNKHHYFPCINPPSVEEEEEERAQELAMAVVLVPKTPEYIISAQNPKSPLLSPFSVRVSNYSSEEIEETVEGENGQVDDQAEEFIRRFYEQLRVQSRVQLLQYQEMQYREMLARGTR